MSPWCHGVAAVLVALACVACQDVSVSSPAAAPKKGGEPPAPVVATPIATVSPEYKTRVSVLETTGKVQFNEEQVVRVNAPVTGRVLEVLARPGDVVEPGHRLLVLDSADLGAAKADYAKAVSDVERATAALKLARELLEAKAIAQKEVREADNDQRKAVAERERAAARMRTLGVPEETFPDVAARSDSSTRVTVVAPRSGVIVERNVTPGQVVAFGQSDTPVSLFVIANLSTMWVVADVYEPDVPKVRIGQMATVRLPCCPADPYEGKIAYISHSVDKDTRTVKVRIVVPNRASALRNEMFVKVTIGTATARILTVPQSAVHRGDGQPFVFVEKGKSEFERRPVRLGADLDGAVEVLEGVTPRDRVAGDGSILLRKVVQ
jgi:cobalt-zinc-cadmium efflux system membrane fusion protein